MSKVYSVSEVINSPNQSSRCGYIPRLIALHIADGTYEGTKAWLAQEASQTSGHFIVGQDGRICQCVCLDKMAWCNGTTTTGDNRDYRKSTVALVKQLGGNANWYSVSIEHEGYYSKTKGALTDVQLEATAWLIGYIRDQIKALYGHEIPLDRVYIVGHNEINPVTKPSCPGESFPWADLMKKLSNSVAEDVIAETVTPTVDTGTATGISKGSIVQFAGGEVFKASMTNTAAGNRAASVCEVTAVAPGAAHPYHLISVDDGTVYGWVDACCVGAVQGSIVVGSMVKITGANYATGQTIPGWVKATGHKVSQIKGEKALLGANGGICSWVYLKDLKLA